MTKVDVSLEEWVDEYIRSRISELIGVELA
jgi:hypothetical protein